MTWKKIGKITLASLGVVGGIVAASIFEGKLADEVAPNRLKLSDVDKPLDYMNAHAEDDDEDETE